MSVHYKFKSALDYDTVNFDGLHISVKDLKSNILQAKRIGKSTDFDLQVTNAQTKEIYTDDEALIPKNTSLLIARIPLATQNKSKSWEGYGGDNTPPSRLDDGGPISKAVDLSSLDASEDDKIRAMMSQSTQDYDPSNYIKIRGANQVGAVPQNYRCYKCHQTGHWIKDCPLSQGPEPIEIKKSTGIPRSFMVQVEGPQVLGAMMTPNGSYAVPLLDHQTYNQAKQVATPVIEEKPEIPEDLLCSICTDLLTDAVMIPCCGISFCDECIRSNLLESDDHECPDCHERNISPGTLIPNRYLRNSVSNFKNTTGYIKKPMPKAQAVEEVKPVEKDVEKAAPIVDQVEESNMSAPIDEPDHKKKGDRSDEESSNYNRDENSALPDLPPGISPPRETSPHENERNRSKRSSRHHGNGEDMDRRERRRSRDRDRERERDRDRERDRERRRHLRSPDFNNSPVSHEERAGTPTVDEPGLGPNSTYPAGGPYSTAPPVISSMLPVGPPPHLTQGPPGTAIAPYPGFPPTGPPPNYRLPPPGVPPNYIAGPYTSMPRPVFDPSRPPLAGHAPPYQNYHHGGRSRSRDYSSRGMRGRSPPRVIDDPLEAFNRMLREKDERDRRARARRGRSYSRSSSRSYSRSPKRMRSRSPKRRSRSPSFSVSRSRSRSRSFSTVRQTREYSPRAPSLRGRRSPSRFRSPLRSPTRYRYKDGGAQPERPRERDGRGRSREYNARDDRGFREEYRDGRNDRDRDYHYKDSREFRPRGKGQWNQNNARQDQYYPQEMQQPPYLPANRYPRDYTGYPNKPMEGYNMNMPPNAARPYEDVAPPGTEQPPIPGEEPPAAHYEDRYSYDKPAEGQNRDRYPKEDENRHKEGERRDTERAPERTRDETAHKSRDKRHDHYNSRSPSTKTARNPSPNQTRDHESPDKLKRKRPEETGDRRDDKERDRDRDRERDRDRDRERDRDRDRDRERDRDRNRDKDRHHRPREASDDEKSKRTKDKKKKREKKEKESDKKAKRRAEKEERREKKHKRSEEKRHRRETNDEDDEKQNEQPDSKDERIVENKCEDTHISDWENDTKENIDDHISKSRPESPDEAMEEDVKKNSTEKKRSSTPIPVPTNTNNKEESKVNNDQRTKADDLYDDIGDDVEKSDPYKSVLNDTANHKDETKKESKTPERPEKVTHEGEVDDILDLHTNEAELKGELDKNEVLAPLPEKSKWEMDEEVNSQSNLDTSDEGKLDKSGKVTNEVLKRAENAIFAKAINAIRPIEIKKISMDRAKLYSGEKDPNNKRIEEVVAAPVEQIEYEEEPPPVVVETAKSPDPEAQAKPRLSVKERLGVKVDDLDRIVRIDRKSRSVSPFTRRHVEIDDKRRFDLHRDRGDRNRSYRNPERSRDNYKGGNYKDDLRRRDELSRKHDKRKRSVTPPPHEKMSHDKHKKSRDKKVKRDKSRKHRRDDEDEKGDRAKSEQETKPKSTTDRRKPTLDEANFEPDYDLETESEKEDDKKAAKKVPETPETPAPVLAKIDPKPQESSSSETSDSSSDEDRKKKKKHKKHKKRARKYSTSSSSESESDSSDDDHKRKRKHKKSKKKRKKSKHK